MMLFIDNDVVIARYNVYCTNIYVKSARPRGVSRESHRPTDGLPCVNKWPCIL